MADRTLEESWDIKDSIAREHKWDLKELVKDLRRAAETHLSESKEAKGRDAAEQGAEQDV
jgi:hypothetical protein